MSRSVGNKFVPHGTSTVPWVDPKWGCGTWQMLSSIQLKDLEPEKTGIILVSSFKLISYVHATHQSCSVHSLPFRKNPQRIQALKLHVLIDSFSSQHNSEDLCLSSISTESQSFQAEQSFARLSPLWVSFDSQPRILFTLEPQCRNLISSNLQKLHGSLET